MCYRCFCNHVEEKITCECCEKRKKETVRIVIDRPVALCLICAERYAKIKEREKCLNEKKK